MNQIILTYALYYLIVTKLIPHEMSMLLKVIPGKQQLWLENLIM